MKDLADFGLEAGQNVRFRRRSSERWKPATVKGVERDGSIALSDHKGAHCAIPPEKIEVHLIVGPRGRRDWVPLLGTTDTNN